MGAPSLASPCLWIVAWAATAAAPSPGGDEATKLNSKWDLLLGGGKTAALFKNFQLDDVVSVCPSSAWVSFGNSCYALMQGIVEPQNIDDAREFCKGNASGADIISINNKEENAFILKSFHTHWHGPEYISLGMFFDTDDDTFKWYDDSRVNFTNWMEEESNEGPVDICATMHTASGRWKKTGCEYLPLTAILCEKAVLYEKKYLPDIKTWTAPLVITSTVIVSVSAAFLWFLYQRKVSSGTRWTVQNPTPQIPYSDEAVLIDEESEYAA